MQKFLMSISLILMLVACSTSTPKTPTSDLGDSPTLTGTISNLAEVKGGVDIASLKVQAEVYNSSLGQDKVIGESTVSASGAFSMKIAGMSTIANDLQEFAFTFGDDCTDVLVEPKTFNEAVLEVKLYSKGQPVESNGEIFYANGELLGGQNQVDFVFADRNVVAKASCGSGNNKFDVDINYKKGWNTHITGLFPDGKRRGFYSGVPDSSYKWIIPVCKIGCI
jgi:hypothetical protein